MRKRGRGGGIMGLIEKGRIEWLKIWGENRGTMESRGKKESEERANEKGGMKGKGEVMDAALGSEGGWRKKK